MSSARKLPPRASPPMDGGSGGGSGGGGRGGAQGGTATSGRSVPEPDEEACPSAERRGAITPSLAPPAPIAATDAVGVTAAAGPARGGGGGMADVCGTEGRGSGVGSGIDEEAVEASANKRDADVASIPSIAIFWRTAPSGRPAFSGKEALEEREREIERAGLRKGSKTMLK